ncbi:MAG: DUF934 domain-containing protein [Candidatus Puniceispirillum sp.]|jgi:uncharacterized protein (DUF934 family)|uniref:DUF934 domain-containing protein n=1 Tax=Candidatus Puniceispirillum sp. TaxID=2026719 RepID=UPI001EB8BEC5|nr:DUF934 domain-containing protein [Candidatus Puniceispirillum sp.]MBT6414899.1 DUF934 domain-containing protein [Candidatus Puniceispirillum sp.]
MRDDDTQRQLFDLADGMVTDMQDRRIADYVFATSDSPPADDEIAGLNTSRVIEISFDKFSDGRGFTYARRIRDSGFSGMLIASGHVIADQAEYLRRCGFSHAEIPMAKIADWQSALSAMPAYFQHMAKSPRSRMVTSAMQNKYDNN